MGKMTSDDKARVCRLIAESLGWHVLQEYQGKGFHLYSGQVPVSGPWPQESDAWRKVPNYFDSEEASASLLEAMPEPQERKSCGVWFVWADHNEDELPSSSLDRKEARALEYRHWKGIQ